MKKVDSRILGLVERIEKVIKYEFKKNMNKTDLIVIVLGLFLTSCSSVKLTNSWSSDRFESAKSKKVLVVARSNDLEVRKAYEHGIVLKLKELKINAVPAYLEFPKLKEDKDRTPEEIDAIVNQFKSKGIEVILLIALKDTKIEQPRIEEYTEVYSSNSNNTIRVRFTDYYNLHSIEYLNRNLRPLNSTNNMPAMHKMESTTYILEALIYDLTISFNDQLVAIYEVEASNPESANQVLDRFTNLITKQLKK